jgi:hypothetical protein
MTLAELRNDLLAAASRKGHVMGDFGAAGVAECAVCFLPVYIREDGVRGLEAGGER